MNQPEIVQSDLGDESIVARVDLGGEDELYVTPTRTLVYRAEGLLSDESVTGYPHGAERITVSEGRRKAKVTLDYGLDGDRTISLPTSRLERALKPIVEGILRHNGVLNAEESVVQLFRFSELTIVVAGERVVRHIGSGLWDEEFESYHYSDVTDLEFEDGSVNTSVVLTVAGQRERFKTPNEDARAVRSALESTLLSYWEVDSIAELRAANAPDEPDADVEESDASEGVGFGDGPDPLFAGPGESEDELWEEYDGEAPDETAPDRTAAGTATSDPDVDRTGQSGTADADGTAAADPSRSETGGGPAPETGTESAAVTDSPSRESAGHSASDTAEQEAATEPPTAGFEGSGFEAAAPATDEQVLEELAALREAVERQNEELTAQRELIEQLIEELRRGR